jgi:hypothetical protein
MRSMLYALDVNGSWVNAKLTKYRKHSQFFCGCAERHPVKLVKPSGVLGKRKFTDHFAHVSKKFKSSDTQHVCMSMWRSGESKDHFNAKHMLREMVGLYRFTTFRCIECRNTHSIYTRGCEVIVEEPSKDRKWRYDCLLRINGNDVAALEVLHSHKVTGEKASSVRDSGLEIAEFRAEDILKLLAVRPTNIVHLENLLVKLGKCQNCLVNAWFAWHRLCLEEELQELIRQDEAIAVHYNNIHEEARRLRIQQEEAITVHQHNMLERARMFRIQQEAAVLVYERECTLWLRDCFEMESQELIRQENTSAVYYNNIHEHVAIMQILPVIDRCQGLLMFHLRHGVHIEIPGVGDVICHKAHKWTHGILVTGFWSSCRLVTNKLCIVLFDGVQGEIEKKYPHPNFNRKFHIFLHCSTVLHRLGHYTGSDKTQVVFKDCRWAMLQKFESCQKICANCGKRGHLSDYCSEQFCMRCGRSGHVRHRCYARSDVLGREIE